ncbi:hypothetical protein F4782DRAFT_552870 [Xylaria castorea]|nr:hypothetical protein F4782DRAFT_552870 [Xylaria castorea]
MGSQALTVAQEKGLAALAAEEKKRKATTVSIVQDIKCSEFFKENWDVLLIAAPCAIKILGNLNAVAATKFAVQTKISQPKKGFEWLTTQPEGKNYLQGALADLSNQSENSFSVARTRMFSIIQDSDGVTQTVKMIMNSLKDPAAPFSEVLMSLDELTIAADSCKTHALDVQNSMGDFKLMAQELYTACRNESADIQSQHAKVQSKKELAQKEEQERIAQEKLAKDHLTKMGEKMDDAQNTFKSTLDKMPTGMDLVGQQILMGLGEAVGDSLRIGTNVAANAAAASINPIGTTAGAIKDLKSIGQEATKQQKEDQKKAAAAKKKGKKETSNTEEKVEVEAEGIIAKLKKPFTRRSDPKKEVKGTKDPQQREASPKEGDEKEKEKKEETASESAESATETPEPAKPAPRQTYGTWDLSGKFDAKDPALTVAVAIKAAIDVIKQAIVGSPNGVDWDSLKPPADAKDGTVSMLALNAHTLQRLRKDFRPQTGGLASQLTVAIVAEAMQLVDELEAEVEKSSALGGAEKPGRKSDTYKDWDERVSHIVSIATTLAAATTTQPGGPASKASLFTPPAQSKEEKVASINQKAAVAEQTVRLATAKLKATQEAYQTSLTTYQTAAEKVMIVQENLMNTKLEIESLKAQHLTLDGIKVVLVRCIAFLEDLKVKIDSLVQFFYRLAELIRVCIQYQVRPFERRISTYGKSGDKAVFYGNYMRDVIFNFALQILAKFSLFRDVAKMYNRVDQEAIKPGLKLVNEVGAIEGQAGMTDDQLFEFRKKKMLEWCNGAETIVKTVVKEQQDSILKTLQTRISDIEQSIAVFPLEYQPDKNTSEAIEGGAALIKDSNQKQIESSQDNSTVAQVMSSSELDFGEGEDDL